MPELLQHLFDQILHPQPAAFVTQSIARLVLAALLGGVIGLEREIKRHPAGLRTNMFICFGSAMFTILSGALAASLGGDHTRIAAQIIPGIGFIGAGSILHSKGGVQGLTTAATVFVVASIGMAVGGGLMLPAVFATILILIGLVVLGWMEDRWALHFQTLTYEAEAEALEKAVAALNSSLEEAQVSMSTIEVIRAENAYRIVFSVNASVAQQQRLQRRMESSKFIQQIRSFSVIQQE